MSEFRERFWQPLRKIELTEIAAAVKAEIVGNKDLLIEKLQTISSATINDLTFLSNPQYSKQLKKSKAGACFMQESDLPILPEGMTALLTDNPHFAWAQTLEMFFPKITSDSHISKSASISPNAKINSGCFIGANAIIEDGAEIGLNCHISPNVYIGRKVIIGDNAYIGHSATIEFSKIGSDVTIHAGARIGQAGFGFANDGNKIINVLQIGAVIIGNNVEIGANTCIDRGAIEDTVIGNNTKIDNLVQIAHNVKIGQNCFLSGQVGIAGSAIIGNGAILGGQVGVNGHIKLNDRAVIAGASVVIRDVKEGEVIGGHPAVDINSWHRQTILLKKMVENYKSSSNKEDSGH